MLFPTMVNKKRGYVNLNIEAQEWVKSKRYSLNSNPLLDPVICQTMVNDVHNKYGLDYSYGGWMEDRSFLWRGSYLESRQIFIHLGIDCNVPAGTLIACPERCDVLKIDSDYPEQGGWGNRVIVQLLTKPICLIFAHLSNAITCKVGDTLKAREVFGTVGSPPFNGNWFAHLHMQCITLKYFRELSKKNIWKELDGYGGRNKIPFNANLFPDPTEFIF